MVSGRIRASYAIVGGYGPLLMGAAVYMVVTWGGMGNTVLAIGLFTFGVFLMMVLGAAITQRAKQVSSVWGLGAFRAGYLFACAGLLLVGLEGIGIDGSISFTWAGLGGIGLLAVKQAWVFPNGFLEHLEERR